MGDFSKPIDNSGGSWQWAGRASVTKKDALTGLILKEWRTHTKLPEMPSALLQWCWEARHGNWTKGNTLKYNQSFANWEVCFELSLEISKAWQYVTVMLGGKKKKKSCNLCMSLYASVPLCKGNYDITKSLLLWWLSPMFPFTLKKNYSSPSCSLHGVFFLLYILPAWPLFQFKFCFLSGKT